MDKQKKLTIFLSHSSKDIEDVRKVRDILEYLDFQPLMFHLCCLDDNHTVLEDFIKAEIDARNVFIYCKSPRSETSPWVQKEVAYIRAKEGARYFELDMTMPFHRTIPGILSFLGDLIRRNTIFLSAALKDKELYEQVVSLLEKNDYYVVGYDESPTKEGIEDAIKNGFFVPLVSSSYYKSWASSEFDYALDNCDPNRIIPLYINLRREYAQHYLSRHAFFDNYLELSTSPEFLSEQEQKKLIDYLSKLVLSVK